MNENDIVINIDDIQGDSLLGFNKPYEKILLFNIIEVNAVRKWLKSNMNYITSVRDLLGFRVLFRAMRKKLNGVKPKNISQICMNIGFSYDGASMFSSSTSDFVADRVNLEFKVGLPLRSTYIGDPSDTKEKGNRTNWQFGGEKNPHIILLIAGENTLEVENLAKTVLSDTKLFLELVANETAINDMEGHEHFGFLDGVSQPAIRGMYKNGDTLQYFTPRTMGSSYPNYGKPGQLLIWPGEIILGLPKQSMKDNDPNPDPGILYGPEWAINGTFLVYRKLKQDVAGFWNWVKKNETNDCPYELLASKVMGRWPSGAPIVRTPIHDNIEIGKDGLVNNAFNYREEFPAYTVDKMSYPKADADQTGISCPLGGHIRKVNSRDNSTDQGAQSNTLRRRILRRGLPYGPQIVDKFKDDQVERGLQFISYQANINLQFEFLLNQWVNHDHQPESNSGYDMVLSQQNGRTASVPVNNSSITLTANQSFIIPAGGGYFFMPSITSLNNIFC